MRKAGVLDAESDARLFSDYLYAKGIRNQADPTRDGKWAIWIHDEDMIAEGERELEHFAANPTDPMYKAASREARALQAEEIREQARSRTKVIDVRTRWGTRALAARGPLTLTLIAISVAVFLAQNMSNTNFNIRQWLAITPWTVQNGMIAWDGALPEVMHGQVWRLITPIFLHFGFMHLLFNMMWIYSLGGAIETMEGFLLLGLQVLVFAITSNLGQFFVAGPTFGGMSGVVYGLFGYTWICGKYDPDRHYTLDRNNTYLIIGWYFLCFSGILGDIANTAHTIGFAGGIVWATIRVRRIPFTNIRF